MNDSGDPQQHGLAPEKARALAETLHAQRKRGAEHRTLRELIANRLRVKKGVAEALYERFDRGWHAGVSASLGKGDTQPSLEDDPLGHFAFEQSRGHSAHLIAERTAQPAAPDAAHDAALSERYFISRSVTIAVFVAAATWWLSDAAGWLLIAVVGAAGFLALTLSMQMATIVEYGVMLALVLVVALAAAFAGFGVFLWPCLAGAVAGALNGIGLRAAWDKKQIGP